MVNVNQTSVVLGDEFDDDLRADVQDVLRSLGAVSFGQEDWGVAGSQELEKMTFILQGKAVLVEAETYVGLSMTGPDDLVTEIKNMVDAKQRMRGNP
jgi:hypothetical protein